jgi:hypothetical protein
MHNLTRDSRIPNPKSPEYEVDVLITHNSAYENCINNWLILILKRSYAVLLLTDYKIETCKLPLFVTFRWSYQAKYSPSSHVLQYTRTERVVNLILKKFLLWRQSEHDAVTKTLACVLDAPTSVFIPKAGCPQWCLWEFKQYFRTFPDKAWNTLLKHCKFEVLTAF